MKILQGITGLLASRKGTAFLLTLAISSVALMTKHLESTAFAAVIATMFGVFTASHAYQQCNNQLPPRGQP